MFHRVIVSLPSSVTKVHGIAFTRNSKANRSTPVGVKYKVLYMDKKKNKNKTMLNKKNKNYLPYDTQHCSTFFFTPLLKLV